MAAPTPTTAAPSARPGVLRRAVGDDPDHRLLQVSFAVLVAVELILRLASGSRLEPWSWPVPALALLALVTVAVRLAPPATITRWALPVALADLLCLGLARLVPEGSGAALLAPLPAILLVRARGRRGAIEAGVAALLLVSVPGALYAGLAGANLARVALIPAATLVVGLVVASALQEVQGERDEAVRRRAELAEAQETIAQHRRTARAIFDTVDVGLVLLDAEGRYVGMNARHHDFMELAFPEGHDGVAGQLGAVHHPDGRPVDREDMPSYRAARGEEFDDVRIWVGQDPLARRALSVSARRVTDEEGRFAGAALAYKDVTEFMRALGVKDEFVATVSHELRTPLTSIAGYLSVLLERDDLPEQAVRHLGVAERNAERLHRLVGDLLSTAQVDAGSLPVHRTDTDLAAVVREALAAHRPAADQAGVGLVDGCPASFPTRVDPHRMAQVLDNLLSNAIKHTPRGGTVRIDLGVDADRIELAVSDTGVGMEAAERDLMFTRFFRTRWAQEQAVPGVGLGLALVREIVMAHGGRVEIESELGRGTTVRVRLPAEIGAAAGAGR